MQVNRVSIAAVIALTVLVGLVGWFHFRLEQTNNRLEQIFEKLDRVESKIQQARATVCNFSVSPILATVAVRVSRRRMRILSTETLPVGECHDFKSLHYAGYGSAYVYGHTRVDGAWEWVNAKVNAAMSEQERSHKGLDAKAGQTIHYHGTADLAFCSREQNRLHDRSPEQDEQCSTTEDLVGFALAGFDEEVGGWFHVFEQSNWALLEGSRFDKEALAEASRRAKRLLLNVRDQSAAEAELSAVQPLAYVGADLVDFNGPLSPGVLAKSVLPKNIYGWEEKLKSGDIIVSINGHSVFGLPDFFRELQAHARDIKRGIGKPLQLGIVREDCPKACPNIPSHYFFNTEYWKVATASEASFWGFADTALLGQQAWMSCAIKDAGSLLGNTLSAALEAGMSWLEDRKFDWSSTKVFYVRTKEELKLCIWQSEQSDALARQVQSEYYDKARLAGILAPGGLRVLFGKAITRGAAKRIGAGVLARGVSDSVTEAAESVLWSLAAAPPGITFEERLKNAQDDLPMAIGIGFATGTMFGIRPARSKLGQLRR